MELEHPFPQRGDAPQACYRLYYLDGVDQLFGGSYEFEAMSDGAAIKVAEEMRGDRPAELWRGATKLKSWS